MGRDTIDDRVACWKLGRMITFSSLTGQRTLKLVRLYLQPDTGGTEQLRFGDLVLDLATRKALRHGRAIELMKNLNCSNI